MPYRVAINFNNEIGLTTLAPQPTSDSGILQADVIPAASGAWIEEGGRYIVLRYSVLTGAEFASLNTQMGIATASYSFNTWELLASVNRTTFDVFNGIVKKPVPPQDGEWRDMFWRDVRYMITRLVEV